MNEILHGGRLDEAVERFGGPRSKWLDLSTGINPVSYPVREIPKPVWNSLPDTEAWNNAADAVRAAYELHPSAAVSLAPGTQSHIQTLPMLFKPQPVAIVGFSYQEHGVCWKRGGHDVFVTDGLESAESTARIVIAVNPNNPDGRILDRKELIGLARRLGAKGGLLVVDESFADVAPNASVADQTGRDGLLVLRSLGKFYGLPGARFGAALGADILIRRMEEMLGPWAVSGPALHLATAALNDKRWYRKTRKKLNQGREKLEEILISNGHEVVGGTGLFVLSKHANAGEVWEHLAEAKILARSFVGKPEWLRFGLPGSKSAFNRLNKVLANFPSPE